MSDSEKETLAQYGRELIKKEYSVSRMAEDTIKVYEWALAKNEEIIISGYYGFKNSGDDALLRAIIDDIKRYKESPNITILSANPKETSKRYRVRAIHRFNIAEFFRHLKKTGLLISGGGTLIQDSTSTKSLIYYLYVINAAIKKGVRVMLYSNGIGPLKNKNNIKIASKILDKTDVITLRDPSSKDVLNKIGVTKPKIAVSADPVFGIDGFDRARGMEIIRKYLPGTENEKIIGVSVRKTKDTNAYFENSVAAMCDYMSEKYDCQCIFIPMQANKDEQISRNIMGMMKSPAVMISERLEVADIISVVSATTACIGMRLHSLIYAAIGSVPLIGISYDPKISGFMDYTGQSLYTDVQKLTPELGMKLADELFERYDDIQSHLAQSYVILKEKARENGRIAVDLYEKGSAEFEQ